MKRFLPIMLIIVLATAIIVLLWQEIKVPEEIVLTTFYPAPYGEYAQLKVAGDGKNDLTPATGDLIVGKPGGNASIYLNGQRLEPVPSIASGSFTVEGVGFTVSGSIRFPEEKFTSPPHVVFTAAPPPGQPYWTTVQVYPANITAEGCTWVGTTQYHWESLWYTLGVRGLPDGTTVSWFAFSK